MGVLLADSCAWGAITACANAARGNTLATYAPAAIGTGCRVVDVSFENLTLTGAVNTGSGALSGTGQTTGNNDIYATGTAASGNTVGPVSLFMNGSSANQWRVDNSAATTGATINYVAIAHTSSSAPYNPAPTSGNWVFSGLVLLPSIGTFQTGQTNPISITLTFCLNATSTAVGTGGCTSGDRGTITANYSSSFVVSYTCVFAAGGCVSGTSNQANFSSALRFNQIAVSNQYLLTTDGNHLVTLNTIENQFLETTDTAELSSFVLLGSALIGFWFLGSAAEKMKAQQRQARARSQNAWIEGVIAPEAADAGAIGGIEGLSYQLQRDVIPSLPQSYLPGCGKTRQAA